MTNHTKSPTPTLTNVDFRPIKKIAIVGIVGLPANYSGFETLAENLVKYHADAALPDQLTVYCSSKRYLVRPPTYLSAQLRYLPLNANGVQSIPYDVWSLLSAVWHRNNVILLLGTSGAIALPLLRLFSSARIITHIDGIEWRREKWQGLAKHVIHFFEKIAVRFSHEVISDNSAIAEYVKCTYGVDSHMITYGGDQAVAVDVASVDEYGLPERYAFSVCRIEPENNVHMILEAFSQLKSQNFVMVGNWKNSNYGRTVREKYASFGNLFMLDPIFDLSKLKTLRSHAVFYIHGHSVGGTNPSLVEAMHFGKPILAFDCIFNRCTMEDKGFFFKNSENLVHLMETMDVVEANRVGEEMLEIAERRYTWRIVAQQYFALFG